MLSCLSDYLLWLPHIVFHWLQRGKSVPNAYTKSLRLMLFLVLLTIRINVKFPSLLVFCIK